MSCLVLTSVMTVKASLKAVHLSYAMCTLGTPHWSIDASFDTALVQEGAMGAARVIEKCSTIGSTELQDSMHA